MVLYSLGDRKPSLGRSSYVSPSATVIGKVTVGEEVWIGPGAVLRGDYGEIIVGDYSAVEENCVLHARPDEKTTVGSHVTIGHAAVIHTGTVQDWAVIGMGAIVSDFSKVGTWAAVGEGAVVKNRDTIPDESIAVGIPAKVIGKIDENYKKTWTEYKARYNGFAKSYREMKEIRS
ncbi:MAG: gamma carbonic anhydrase family protein [Candidatus Thermoplasmatota archaeon]|nr:gamma carbonic anhydrase family protein [Candidatus Thermoplasmatota archaeon]MCL5730563.1 gamma carbonic anhydrase family protein [Candidatus Thermoplasmatota archaeon]